MSADDRRTALVDATLPLLLEHGRAVTSRQIAEAAGVAEGTIFRVFDSKEELLTAALDHAFDPEPFLADLRRIEVGQPLRHVVADLVSVLQTRFRGIFELMTAVGMVGPPTARKHSAHHREEATRIMIGLLTPYADELSAPVEHFIHVTRLLTFAGSHPHVCDGRLLTTDEILTTVLDGLRSRDV